MEPAIGSQTASVAPRPLAVCCVLAVRQHQSAAVPVRAARAVPPRLVSRGHARARAPPPCQV